MERAGKENVKKYEYACGGVIYQHTHTHTHTHTKTNGNTSAEVQYRPRRLSTGEVDRTLWPSTVALQKECAWVGDIPIICNKRLTGLCVHLCTHEDKET